MLKHILEPIKRILCLIFGWFCLDNIEPAVRIAITADPPTLR
jgi:hypothetical protein